MGNQKKERIFTKSFFLLFGGLLFTSLVMYALMSTVTEYATAMGTTATVAGLVSGIYIFGGLCSRVYSGNALGRIRWRKIAMIFLTIHFLACLLYFLVNNVVLLLLVRLIHGIGFGASSNSIVTIASEVLPKKRFGEAFGYLMLGTTISVGLGPYVSGILYDNFSSRGCFIAASIFSALGLVSMFFLDINKFDPKLSKKEKDSTAVVDIKVVDDNEITDDITVIDETKEKKETEITENIEIITNVDESEDITERDNIKENEVVKENEDVKEKEDIKEKENIKEKEDTKEKEDVNEKENIKEKEDNKEKVSLIEKVFEPGAIPISLSIALTSLGYVSILSFYRLYASQVNLTSAFSWFFILYSFTLLISRPIAGKIQDKHGDKLICITGIIAQSVGLFIIAHWPNTVTVLICAVCAALGFGTLNSAATAIVTRKAPQHRSSYAISTLFILIDATMGFGPALLGSFVTDKLGYATVYYISSLITILALPVCLFALRK